MTLTASVWLAGLIILGIFFGRNTLTPMFGTAIGTKMISVHVAGILGTVFFTLGALLNSSGTLSTVGKLSFIQTPQEAFLVCIGVTIILIFLNKQGIPLSIAQAVIGALVGVNLFYGYPLHPPMLYKVVSAWILAPFIAAFWAYMLFLLIRQYIRKHPIGLLYRDAYLRVFLLIVGCCVAFGTGANNAPVLIGPYQKTPLYSEFTLLCLTSLSIGIGFWTLQHRKIKIISTALFPLTPTEAFVSALATAMTLFLFSNGSLHHFIRSHGLPFFPLVPLPVSSLMIGSIVGISCLKGINGLKIPVLARIVLSWIATPCISCLICIAFLSIMNFKGI